MGQSFSNDLETVDDFPEELFRQARQLSEFATLTYEEFEGFLTQLNELSQKCMDANGKQLVFEVKEGTDSTVFWKGMIRISCIKIDPTTKEVVSSRLLNLSQFIKVYKSISNQCAAAADPSTSNMKELTSEMLGQISSTSAECCICLERKPNMILPCAHAYCRPCIEQWSFNHNTCPICREEADKDDAWVLSEAPNTFEMSEEICSSLMEIVEKQTSTEIIDDEST